MALISYDNAPDDALLFAGHEKLVHQAKTPQALAQNSDIILSLVTADQAVKAAQMIAPHLEDRHIFFDGNSVSPGTKKEAASYLASSGVAYCDMAIMAPIHPRAHKTPMLVASSAAEDAIACMTNLGMDATLVGKTVGRASTIKMLRSVMVKGIEALTAECFRAACRAGVAQDVAASLDASQSQLGWADQTAYNLERMTTHGLRRAAEMREVTKTLQDLGVASEMTNGTVNWQQSMGDLNILLDDVGGLHDRMATIEESDSNQNGN